MIFVSFGMQLFALCPAHRRASLLTAAGGGTLREKSATRILRTPAPLRAMLIQSFE
jgi:hypothetical protein